MTELERLSEEYEQEQLNNLGRVLTDYMEYSGEVSNGELVSPSRTPWTQEPPTKTVSTPLFENEAQANATPQDASMEQQVDNMVSNMTIEQLREVVRDTVIQTVQDYFAERDQSQEQQAPEPEQAQDEEQEISSLLEDMSTEDITEVMQQFNAYIEQQDQSQELNDPANDNSQQPDDGDDPGPPSSLQQYLADNWQGHELDDEQEQSQQRAIAY